MFLIKKDSVRFLVSVEGLSEAVLVRPVHEADSVCIEGVYT